MLSAVAQLMAYAAKADGRVSADELEALQQFLAERYTDAARAEFFAFFREAIDHRALDWHFPRPHDLLQRPGSGIAGVLRRVQAVGGTASYFFFFGGLNASWTCFRMSL
jgi:hypothetical protein